MTEAVLVGVDSSAPSRAALSWAVSRAASVAAEMHLVHVVDGEWVRSGGGIGLRMEQEALELLEREAGHARALLPSVPISTEVRHGSVVQELVKVSAHASLSVMGTHKTGFISGRVFGSRSVAFGAAARSPAAIIPQSAITVRQGQRSIAARHGVVVGVDNTSAGLAAIHLAATEAARSHEPLTLLRAFDLPRAARDRTVLRAEALPRAESIASRIIAEAAEVVERDNAGLAVATRVVQGLTAEVLVDASEAAALLVIGGADSTTWATASMGQTVHDVLINLATPTIVARPGRAL